MNNTLGTIDNLLTLSLNRINFQEIQAKRHAPVMSSRLGEFKKSRIGIDSEFIVRISSVEQKLNGAIETKLKGLDEEVLFFAKSISTPDETLNFSYDAEKMHVVLGGIEHPPLTMQLYCVSDESLDTLFELYSNQFTEQGTFRLFSSNDGVIRIQRNIVSTSPSHLGYEQFTLRGLRFSRPVLSPADSSSNAVSIYTVTVYYQIIEFS